MWSITKCAAGLVCVVVFTGCYEEIEPQQSQQQTTQTPPKEGPISGQVSQGGGSALGGAKRAATNIVREAEEKSQRTAREADPNAPATPANDEP